LAANPSLTAPDALEDETAALAALVEQLDKVAASRLAVGVFREGPIPGLGGAAGELSRSQALELRDLAGRLRGGAADPTAIAEQLFQLGEAVPALQDLGQAAVDSAIRVSELHSQLDEFGASPAALERLAAGADQELSRLEQMLQRVDAAVDTTSMSFRDLYMDVVGGSYVPDMVTEAGGWFDRLEHDMTTKTEAGTSAVAEAFAGLDRQVSYRLGSMIAHGKTTLADFADFTQDILGQILGSLIGAGINAGIGALFSSPAAVPAGGGTAAMPEVLHQGGIAGAAGNPRRLVPWSLFAGAERYHRGGTVLRPGEVPAILQRGERVTPAGQAAGNMTVIINDQRRGGQAVETRERRNASGDRELEVFIRDRVSGQLARGDHDTAMAARYGARAALR
jgi:hypothetical protein